MKKQSIWKERFQKFREPTRVCKICFQTIKTNNLYILLNKNCLLCNRCYKKVNAKFISFDVDGVKALSIYNYDEELESLIYQFKGCYDIELAPIFLERYIKELKLYFTGFEIVPIPSYYLDDELRGFNHVVEIYKLMNLPIINLLVKTERFKQASNSKKSRKEINKFLSIKESIDLSDKKILLVDDVYTTGSTMKAALKLVNSLHPKDVKILVITKTIFKSKPNTN